MTPSETPNHSETLTGLTDACDRLDAAITADTLTRKRWTAEDNGRHLACLLAALAPECGEAEDASACPATIMPAWLAHLTPWIDDAGSLEAWQGVVREYARLLRASVGLTAAQWARLDYACRAVFVREARAHVGADISVPVAIDGVLVLLDRAAGGGSVSSGEWAVAKTTRATRAVAAEARADRIIEGCFVAWRAMLAEVAP